MIELKIEGVCKECPFKDLTLIQYGKPKVFCLHETVCKFIGDPQGKERLYATMKTLEEREEFKPVTWDDMEGMNNA